MSMRNPINGNVNDNSVHVTNSYLRDFSAQYQSYRLNQKDEGLISSIHRSISLLGTISLQQYNSKEIETTQFFVDLHGLIGTLGDCDTLWSCIGLLQNCSKNPEVRKALIEDYRFVPLLATLLKHTQLLSEKATKLLILLQDLTYGIRITWEEPYISVLLNVLMRTVYTATEEGEEKQALLALSIMINLCYKNFPVLLLFMRSVNISEFSKKIQHYGALANKMMIVLSQDLYAPEQKELHLLLRSTFASVRECLKDWNVAHLRHIVDFLTDSKSHGGLHNSMLQYTLYCEDIERLLDPLEADSNMNDSKEEMRKQRQICQQLIFKLILYILELSTVPVSDGNENIISLDSIVPRIFDILCQCIESDICGADAVRLIDGLINLARGEPLAARIARDSSIVVHLLSLTENPETQANHTVAILKLLLSLLQQTKTEKLILSKVSESYFDKIFAPVLNSNQSATIQEVEKTVFCLLLLTNFAGIAKKAYFEKCCSTLQLPQIQNALARATLNGGEDTCDAVFKISQFEYFPRKAISKIIASHNKCSSTPTLHESMSQTNAHQLHNLNEILRTHKQFASTETEERLRALIETITLAQRSNQLNNVPTTQIMELYNYKIEKYKCMEISMQRRLEEASNEITHLTQRIHLQNAELQKYHDLNFELHINIQSLETQSQDLKKQRENLKRNLTDLLKKSSQQSESLQISEKRLSVKVSELIALQKEHNDLKVTVKTKNEQLEKLENMSKENVMKIDKLKKTISAFEIEIKDKLRILDEKERELVKVNKALEAEKEAKKKSDGFISVLEAQIQEKNEEIRSYERELSETEELRKTIMSLMESKKPKRKA